MSDRQTVDAGLSDLDALVENIVEQVLGKELNKKLTSWMVNSSHISSRLSYQNDSSRGGGNQVFGALERLGVVLSNAGKLGRESATSTTASATPYQGLNNFGTELAGAAGLISAYQNGDALGGAMSGVQLASFMNVNPVIGASIGLLAGLLGKPKSIDEWNQPKFTPANQAYETQFILDRGEKDLYYMPDSFYFRTGSTGRQQIVVKIGNEQLDDHIRDSLTNAYASQLQRGLVF